VTIIGGEHGRAATRTWSSANDIPPPAELVLLGQHVVTMFPATVLVALPCGVHVSTVARRGAPRWHTPPRPSIFPGAARVMRLTDCRLVMSRSAGLERRIHDGFEGGAARST